MTVSTLSRSIAALGIALLVAACTTGGGSSPAPSAVASSAVAGYPAGCPTAQPAPLGKDEKRVVTINTDKGDIAMEIDGALSPIATGNFVALAECGYYDGVVFHRVVPGFVIQGGDGQYGRSPNVDPVHMGQGGPPYTIQDEPVTTPYTRGTVAMARTAEPNSVGIAVLHRARRRRGRPAREVQHLPDHREGDVGHGHRGRDRRRGRTQENPTNPVVMTKVSVATP